MGDENHNNSCSDRSPGTNKEWNIPHRKKHTLHQIDFYLILTLSPRNGLLCCIIKKRVIIIMMIIHFI